MSKNVLTQKDLDQVGRRWFMAIESFNYETQMAGSVVYALAPALRKIYKDDDSYVDALNNHFKYFNTHPWIANLILGAALAIEDDKGLEGKNAVTDLKVSLMGPLAGVGDSIFWVLIPTIFGSIGGYMALEGNPFGLIAWLIYSAAMFVIRPKMVGVGYRSGMKLINQFGQKLNVFTESISALGLVIMGALVSSASSVSTPLTFTSGEVVTEIQGLLNSILPSMIPVALTAAISLLLKKKISLSWIIAIVIVFSWVCAAFGILA